MKRSMVMNLHARPLSRALLGLGLSLASSACNDLERIDDSGTHVGIPDAVQLAFDNSCATASCHDGGGGGGGLSLTAGAAAGIIGGASEQSSLPLVELGNVQGSYLALKLLPGADIGATTRMPQGRDFNDPEVALDSAVILGWIAGAELPGGGGGGGDTTDGGESSTGAPEVVMCGVAEVAPDDPVPFDIGTAAGQIPPDVGAALTNNCGCHEVTTVIEGAVKYGGAVHFSTHAEIQSDFMGTAVYDLMLARVQSTEFNRMPPTYYCVLEDGEPITAADQQLLIDWLTAGAPDAPNWNP